MSWVSLVSGLVKFANLIAGWIRDEKLVESGVQKERGEAASDTLETLVQENKFRDGVVSSPDALDKLRRELERPSD